MRLAPFSALRPSAELAARVASVPYDVVDRAEAVQLANGNPHSFLRVVRSEIDLPETIDAYDERVYAAARDNLATFRRDGVLRRDDVASLYIYRLIMGNHAQTGVVGNVHVDDYDAGVIRRHEKTRPDKEDDRTRHMLTLRAHAEPVLLAFRNTTAIDPLITASTARAPLCDFTAADGVRHTLWRAFDSAALAAAFAALPRCYVADGHHRCAAALRAANQLRQREGAADAPWLWFPAALFATAQLRILPYHRVVRDLGGRTADDILTQLGKLGTLTPTRDPTPGGRGRFCFFAAGAWHRLTLPADAIDSNDPIRSLDVSMLQERVLGPILGIGDPRTDKRLDFVGGIRGPDELERRVRAGRAAMAIAMHPTSIDQLLAVADAATIMPPKSTWFEPKLRSGLFVHGWH